MDPVSLKRPKPGDGEEELFRMQEEFLKSNHEPAAKVINLRPVSVAQTEALSTGRRRSKFSESKRSKGRKKGITTSQSGGEVLNAQISGAVAQDDVTERTYQSVSETIALPPTILLGNIVERTFDSTLQIKPENASVSDISKSGFPEVFSVSKKVYSSILQDLTTTVAMKKFNGTFFLACPKILIIIDFITLSGVE